jgi:hypothetical protein
MSKTTPELEVRPNEYDGWDVKHAGTADAISNFPDKGSAEEAARRIAEHEEGDPDVVVKREADEGGADDTRRGVKFYFLVLLALLALVAVIIVVVSLIGGGTEFGANDANLGE